MGINRRAFLGVSGAVGLAAVIGRARLAVADELPKDVTITRVTGFDLPLARAKIAGRNARLDVHGDKSNDRMARIETSAGVIGIGACRADEAAARKIVGQSLSSLFKADRRRFECSLGAGTMPLWDAAGKLLKQPAYKLLGGEDAGKLRERVPVYDGSIYFADLLPQYADRWQDRFKEEIDQGKERGHIAFKIKVGRGNKWMPRGAGDDRDVEVVEVIRAHAGADAILGVDANNGYDPAGAAKFVSRTAAAKLAFVEELFEERVEECLALKKQMAELKLATLLADGETQSRLDPFKPLVAAKAIDVLQGDMVHFGFEGILEEAEMGRPQGILVAPHNWGSLLGYYMQLHVGRAIENFYRAEHDPLSTPVLIAEGYSIKNGEATVPEAAGFGLALDERKFAEGVKVRFDLRA